MGLGDIVQKAFYLGVGLGAYVGEKGGTQLAQLRDNAEKLVEEMVAKGEMTTEEARRLVEALMKQANTSKPPESAAPEPRPINIEDEESDSALVQIRSQVQDLEAKIKLLKQGKPQA